MMTNETFKSKRLRQDVRMLFAKFHVLDTKDLMFYSLPDQHMTYVHMLRPSLLIGFKLVNSLIDKL